MEFAKILEYHDTNYLRVKYRTGEEQVVPMIVMGASVSLPSEEWLNTNKDKFLAIVAYERSKQKNAMVIGFYPLEAAKTTEYDNHYLLYTMFIEFLKFWKTAKINTQLGPQTIMPDSMKKLNEFIEKAEDTFKNLLEL